MASEDSSAAGHDDGAADDRLSTSRRSLLGGLGGLSGLLAGCAALETGQRSMSAATATREFTDDIDLNGNDIIDVGAIRGGVDIESASVDSWNVVDVSEAGVEPGSDADLGAFIDEHFDRSDVSSAIYYLPEGTYQWNTPVSGREFDAFGIVGQPQARVRCTNRDMPYFISLGTDTAGRADAFIARNVEFDVRTDGVAATAILASVDDYIEIDNCELVGELDRVVPPYYSIVPTLLTEDGMGYVSVTMNDGSFFDPSLNEQSHPMGLAIERNHLGYLVIENSEISGFVNNGIYSAGHSGKVAIRNTTVRNCGAGMLRLGDGDYAYKCELINDDNRDYSYAALWVTQAEHAVADSVEIVSKSRTPSELVRVNADVDHCTLANIDIRNEVNQYILEFTGSGLDTGQVVASNWTIRDLGSASSNAQMGRIARPNVVMENWDVHIDPAGDGKRHGIIVDGPWTDIRGCTFKHADGGFDLLLDDGADYLRLKDCDFQQGELLQYGRATVEEAIVADNRFVDGTTLAGEQVNWTTRGPGFE